MTLREKMEALVKDFRTHLAPSPRCADEMQRVLRETPDDALPLTLEQATHTLNQKIADREATIIDQQRKIESLHGDIAKLQSELDDAKEDAALASALAATPPAAPPA
jgi:uncharacterized coiled-coil protein SlyX